MSRRILVILLVVSLMFNAAVLIGFARARAAGGVSTSNSTSMPATAPEEKSLITRLARELGLDESQSGALEGLRRRQLQQSSVFGDSVLVVRQDLQQELRKEQPDLERVRTLVDQEADLVRQRRQAEAELYGEFVTMLTPDQRQRLGRRVGSQPPPPGGPDDPQPRSRDGQPRQQRGGMPQQPPPPEIVRRFDHNNNGRLDGDEMRVARKELEARRREVAPHVQQRPPLWPWFDADDDGELNEAEKAEMDEFMRTHHAPPPPPQSSTEPDGRNGRDRRPDPNRPERGDRRGPPNGLGPDGPIPGNPAQRPPLDGPPPPPQQRPPADSPGA